MAVSDLYPTREKLKKAFSPDYWRGRTVWWYMEQILSLAFVVLALFHAGAVADYKTTIQHEFEENRCSEILQDGVDADLYNQSELPAFLTKESYRNLTGVQEKKKEPDINEVLPGLEKDYPRKYSD